MRYKDVTNRPVATPTFTVDRNTTLGTDSMLVDMLPGATTGTLTAPNVACVSNESAGVAISPLATSL